MALDRETIISAALALIDESGLDEFTTRRLADRLHVKQPALYWHFRGKTALLDALAEAIMDRGHTYPLPRPGDDWRSFLLENARSFRNALLSVRDGARIHAGTRPRPDSHETAEKQIRFLCDQGFDEVDAVRALIAISRYVVGVVLEEQAASAAPADGDAGDSDGTDGMPESSPGSAFLVGLMARVAEEGPDREFEFGLQALVDGLAQRRRG
ncbi:transcriptional regulator, TetR family [Streptoalloteichus tenebrarius]|uniref:Transcriptional regulator, TetR family n=1 Tax=Streptoalloteichus tenebrarius (strain ATCC 17920 / DSM 40477 / JCM 4838 / CBS 697.72 / NBRC 16177 / NCIMB 11028 / NRRL B-12390 / A12253. 1 / ISP 5477) TaxID=1933 RepID=A0ABT1HUJ8_STRSD|nr:TetR/AcrR family transcriptional regulator C-terminal domain-containing protein [Streptoalloteichus tenebrarius]MCP2259194.1 transcriptional regulator, TetR family [Streptoalloteichus tenebrarius]BFF04325.1 tetracycline resistance transcriptional repressor TetR(A) [Streptoalloteichus tenebrarius]